jgi:hypothetical protein
MVTTSKYGATSVCLQEEKELMAVIWRTGTICYLSLLKFPNFQNKSVTLEVRIVSPLEGGEGKGEAGI